MTPRERDRRRREKHKAQKQRRRANIIEDAERRLLGYEPLPGTTFEELHYDHQLGTTDRAKVHKYLARRYPGAGMP